MKHRTTSRLTFNHESKRMLYTARQWGDDILVKQAGLTAKLAGSNFQPLPLLPVREDHNGEYIDNSGTYSAVVNSLIIPRADMDRVMNLQPSDGFTVKEKMQWLCYGGRATRPMWTGTSAYDYANAPKVYWGTIAIGGRPLLIDKETTITVKLPEENNARPVRMGRVVCFRKTDWYHTYPWLVQRQAGADANDRYDDAPKGTILCPLFSPLDWKFAGPYQPTAFYIPMDWVT